MTYTPIADTEYKNDIIEHINEDHPEAVLDIALTYLGQEARTPRLTEVYQEGIILSAGDPAQKHFIPFQLKEGDTDEQIHYLVFRSALEQGRPLGGGKNQYFTVSANQKTTPNMQRLTLQSASPLPENEPGYAWCFKLKTHQNRPNEDNDEFTAQEQAQQIALLESLREADSETRGKALDPYFEGLRYYTLRSTAKSRPDAPFADTATVDIYLHGNTPGSLWASALKPGDIIRSTSDFHEQTAHLAQGRALLIGDETALPTVAALLENWQNPTAPVVISITDDPADQAYLPDSLLPPGATLHRLSSRQNLTEALKACLKNHEIDTAWGAFEAEDATAIRKYLSSRGLERRLNRIKGYWRKTQQTG